MIEANGSKNLSEIKVLIVEDEELLSKMYYLKFTNQGFKAFQAFNGVAGLELAKKEKPNIILLDIIMPQLDGFGVLKELKSNKETKDISVILLTNLGQDDDIKKGKNLGAIDYLIKSNSTPLKVVEKVKEILEIK